VIREVLLLCPGYLVRLQNAGTYGMQISKGAFGRRITTEFPGTTSVPVPKYKTPVRQAAEQNRITLESVVPEIFGPDLNSAVPRSATGPRRVVDVAD
jgi:hypothetical protein